MLPELLCWSHDLIRKVCNFSGSCVLWWSHDLIRKVCNFSGSCCVSLGRGDPGRHPAPVLSPVSSSPDGARAVPGMLPRPSPAGFACPGRASAQRERRSGTQEFRAEPLQYCASRVLRWVPGLHPLGQAASLLSPGTRQSAHPSPTSSSSAASSGRAATRTTTAPAADSGAATWRERQ